MRIYKSYNNKKGMEDGYTSDVKGMSHLLLSAPVFDIISFDSTECICVAANVFFVSVISALVLPKKYIVCFSPFYGVVLCHIRNPYAHKFSTASPSSSVLIRSRVYQRQTGR